MEKEKSLTPQESLALITETLNRSRRDILKGNAKYFILWGVLLTVVSLVIYLLWHFTGKAVWNILWFTMPVIGYAFSSILRNREPAVPESFVGKLLGQVWAVFGAFSVTLSVLALSVAPMNVTLVIVILMGLSECLCGVVLKNWPIIAGGFILGIAGAVAAVILQTEAQLLLFTIGGILLAVTGAIVRYQYR